METRKFNYFMTVAELGSFSRAAVSLRLSQPLLSRQVRNLEEELGLPLFYRNGRGVTLTQAGRCLLKNARNVQDAIDMTYAELSRLKSQLAGVAAIGMPTSVGRALSVPLARHFGEHLSEVKLHLVEGLSSDIVEQIQQSRLDVAIVYSPIRSQSMLCDPVVEERLKLVSPRGQAPSGPLTLDELLDLPLIMTGPHQQLRRDLETAARERGRELSIAVEVDALGTIIQMVDAGLGHAILPPSSLLRHVSMEHFEITEIESDVTRRILYVATGPQRSASVPARKLASLVKDKLIGLSGPATWNAIRPA